MGGALSSNFNWDSPPAPGLDAWGYVPPNLKPSQHLWSELYSGTDQTWRAPSGRAMRTKNQSISKDQSAGPIDWNGTRYFGLMGQGIDVMETFGSKSLPTLQNNALNSSSSFNFLQNQPYNWNMSQQWQPAFPASNLNGWIADTATIGKVCTPENYPNCDMNEWRQGNDKQPVQNPNWWTHNVAVTNTPKNLTVQYSKPDYTTPNQPPVNLPDMWLNKINLETANYQAGGLAELNLVNTKDTSGWDPCQGSGMFGNILPLLSALAAYYVPHKLGDSFIQLLQPESRFVLDISLLSVGHDVGRMTVLNSWIGGDPEAVEVFKAKAAASICYAGGAIGAQYGLGYLASNPNQWQTYGAMVLGAYFTRELLFDSIIKSVGPASIGFGLIGTIVWALDSVGTLLCRWANYGQLACDDTNEFPDSRKWDVSSIAARLTDWACSQQGWSREDPRAEFVFRGLITSPALMWAATEDPSYGGVYAGYATNPLGSWLQVHDNVRSMMIGNQQELRNFFTGVYTGISGIGSEESWDVTSTEHNRYACNNFEVLLNATQQGGATEADKLLSANLRNWVQKLVEQSQNPNNIRNQALIPGLSSKAIRTPNWEIDEVEFLKTCNNDFNASTGTGFNDIKWRGVYASNYEVNNVEELESVLIVANTMFTYDNETLAFNYAKDKLKFTDNSLTALVHYWHKPKGAAQQVTFDVWRTDHINEEISKRVDAPDQKFDLPPNGGFQGLRSPGLIGNPFDPMPPPREPGGPGEPISYPPAPPPATTLETLWDSAKEAILHTAANVVAVNNELQRIDPNFPGDQKIVNGQYQIRADVYMGLYMCQLCVPYYEAVKNDPFVWADVFRWLYNHATDGTSTQEAEALQCALFNCANYMGSLAHNPELYLNDSAGTALQQYNSLKGKCKAIMLPPSTFKPLPVPPPPKPPGTVTPLPYKPPQMGGPPGVIVPLQPHMFTPIHVPRTLQPIKDPNAPPPKIVSDPLKTVPSDPDKPPVSQPIKTNPWAPWRKVDPFSGLEGDPKLIAAWLRGREQMVSDYTYINNLAQATMILDSGFPRNLEQNDGTYDLDSEVLTGLLFAVEASPYAQHYGTFPFNCNDAFNYVYSFTKAGDAAYTRELGCAFLSALKYYPWFTPQACLNADGLSNYNALKGLNC